MFTHHFLMGLDLTHLYYCSDFITSEKKEYFPLLLCNFKFCLVTEGINFLPLFFSLFLLNFCRTVPLFPFSLCITQNELPPLIPTFLPLEEKPNAISLNNDESLKRASLIIAANKRGKCEGNEQYLIKLKGS